MVGSVCKKKIEFADFLQKKNAYFFLKIHIIFQSRERRADHMYLNESGQKSATFLQLQFLKIYLQIRPHDEILIGWAEDLTAKDYHLP